MKPTKAQLKKMNVREIFACPGVLFWDVHIDMINPYYEAEFIIIRALNRAYPMSEYLKEIDKVYPRELILQVLAKRNKDILGIEDFESIGEYFSIDLTQYEKYNQLYKVLR